MKLCASLAVFHPHYLIHYFRQNILIQRTCILNTNTPNRYFFSHKETKLPKKNTVHGKKYAGKSNLIQLCDEPRNR